MPPDPSTNHHIATEKHHHDTGLWLLEHQTYMAWKESQNSFMWIYGMGGHKSYRNKAEANITVAGAGKTILL